MLIHLEKLGKSFGEKVVLHDVSASVEKEVYVHITWDLARAQAVLQAAELLVDRDGYDALTMTSLAAELDALAPKLPDDGFRNLEHWVTHHLGNRIETRLRHDREDLRLCGMQYCGYTCVGEG